MNWVRIHQEIADQCLESAQKLLGEKEGAEFDKCYIGLTIVSHQQAVDVDEVFANYVSREFQAELEECQQIAASHLDEAKEIMEGLANDQ